MENLRSILVYVDSDITNDVGLKTAFELADRVGARLEIAATTRAVRQPPPSSCADDDMLVEKLFNLCDDYADSTKKKVHIWPLQNAALVLCPV